MQMPSGAYVEMSGNSPYWAISVAAISDDFGHSTNEGLCGNNNGIPGDDIIPKGSSTVDSSTVLLYGWYIGWPRTFTHSYM